MLTMAYYVWIFCLTFIVQVCWVFFFVLHFIFSFQHSVHFPFSGSLGFLRVPFVPGLSLLHSQSKGKSKAFQIPSDFPHTLSPPLVGYSPAHILIYFQVALVQKDETTASLMQRVKKNDSWLVCPLPLPGFNQVAEGGNAELHLLGAISSPHAQWVSFVCCSGRVIIKQKNSPKSLASKNTKSGRQMV